MLFEKLPGLTAMATCYEWMHAKLLGTNIVFHGSCLWPLCHELLPDSPLENLDMLEKNLSIYEDKHIFGKASRYEQSDGRKLTGRAKMAAKPRVALHWEKMSRGGKQGLHYTWQGADTWSGATRAKYTRHIFKKTSAN